MSAEQHARQPDPQRLHHPSPPPVKAIAKTDTADRPVTQPAVQRSCPCLIDGLSPFGCFVFPHCRQKFKAFLADRKLRENNLMDHFGKCSTTGFSKFRKRIRNERGYETAWERHVTNWTICNKNRENVTQPTRKRKWTHKNKMGHHGLAYYLFQKKQSFVFNNHWNKCAFPRAFGIIIRLLYVERYFIVLTLTSTPFLQTIIIFIRQIIVTPVFGKRHRDNACLTPK